MFSFLGICCYFYLCLYKSKRKKKRKRKLAPKLKTKTIRMRWDNDNQQRERQKHAIPPVIQSIMMKRKKCIHIYTYLSAQKCRVEIETKKKRPLEKSFLHYTKTTSLERTFDCREESQQQHQQKPYPCRWNDESSFVDFIRVRFLGCGVVSLLFYGMFIRYLCWVGRWVVFWIMFHKLKRLGDFFCGLRIFEGEY